MVVSYFFGEFCIFLNRGISLKLPFLSCKERKLVIKEFKINSVFKGKLFLPASVGQVLGGNLARAAIIGPLLDYYPLQVS